MASNYEYSRDNSGSRSIISNTQYTTDSDDLTRSIVKQLKEQIRNNPATKDTSVEQLVAKIRRSQSPNTFALKDWRRNLPRDAKDCSDSTLHSLMAYGDDPTQLTTIIKAKMNNEDSSETPTDTSLENIIEPLRVLKKSLKEESSRNLLQTILAINEKEIDRADRMFYSEAYRLIHDLKGYTFENAHDQVQAIRLTHYESDSEDELVILITKYRTFDEAYSYLKRFAKRQTTNNQSNTYTNNTSHRSQSIAQSISNNRDDLINSSHDGNGSRRHAVGTSLGPNHMTSGKKYDQNQYPYNK